MTCCLELALLGVKMDVYSSNMLCIVFFFRSHREHYPDFSVVNQLPESLPQNIVLCESSDPGWLLLPGDILRLCYNKFRLTLDLFYSIRLTFRAYVTEEWSDSGGSWILLTRNEHRIILILC